MEFSSSLCVLCVLSRLNSSGIHFDMKFCKLIFSVSALLALLAAAGAPARAEEKALYENNFEKAEVGKVPDDFLVLDGGFVVKEDGGNKVLELPGAPLDTFGLLFGPTEKFDAAVSVRIKGTRKGRRYPTF